MARPGARRRLSFPLLILCVGLGYVVYLQGNAELPLPDEGLIAAQPLEPAPNLPADPEFQMPPLTTFSETLSRPLFMATRRPPEPQPEEEAPEPPKLKAVPLELSGIIISPTERLALLKPRRSREPIRVTVGQEIEGWVVHRILPDRVILHQGEVTEELVLKDRPPPAAGKARRRETQERQTQAGKPAPGAQPEAAPE